MTMQIEKVLTDEVRRLLNTLRLAMETYQIQNVLWYGGALKMEPQRYEPTLTLRLCEVVELCDRQLVTENLDTFLDLLRHHLAEEGFIYAIDELFDIDPDENVLDTLTIGITLPHKQVMETQFDSLEAMLEHIKEISHLFDKATN